MVTRKRKAKEVACKTIDQFFSKKPQTNTVSVFQDNKNEKNTTDENAAMDGESGQTRRRPAQLTLQERRPLTDIGGTSPVVQCHTLKPPPHTPTFNVLRDEDISKGVQEAPPPPPTPLPSSTVVVVARSRSATPCSFPSPSPPSSPRMPFAHLQTQTISSAQDSQPTEASSPALSLHSTPPIPEEDSDADSFFFDDLVVTRTKRPHSTYSPLTTSPSLLTATASAPASTTAPASDGTALLTRHAIFLDDDNDDDDDDGALIPSFFDDPASSSSALGGLAATLTPTIEFSISASLDHDSLPDSPLCREGSCHEHLSTSSPPLPSRSDTAASTPTATEPTFSSQDAANLAPTLSYPHTRQYDAHIPYPVPRGKTLLEKFGLSSEKP